VAGWACCDREVVGLVEVAADACVLAIEGSATSGWVVRHAGAEVYRRAWG
jgi:hypothetical protein